MGDILGWGGFFFSVAIALWVLWDMLPAGLATFVRRAFNLTLHILNWLGEGVFWLLDALWSNAGARVTPAPVSTLSGAPSLAYVAPPHGRALDPQTDHGLSGLSGANSASVAITPGDAWIESLDTGSRQRAIALLVKDDWGVGKIRKVVTGDNGEIGKEIAEARRQLGLDEDPAGLKPVSGLPRQAEAYAGEQARVE
jgi:hypothetical protein